MTEIQTKMPYLPLKKQMMYGLSYKIALLFFTIFVSVQGYAQADKKAEARSFLMQHAAKWGLSAEQAQQVRVSDAYTSKGITHYYFQQTYQDLPVYNALMNVVVLPKGESKMTANRFVKNLPKESSAGIPTFSPENAISAAAKHLNLRYLKKTNLKAIDKDALAKGAFMSKYLFEKGDISTEDITVELLWVNDAENQVHLAWNILIYETSLSNIWQVRVDAISGEVIEKNNYVAHCDWGNHSDETTHLALHHEVDKVEGEFSTLATGDYNVFDMPLEAPSFGSRTIVNAPWTRAGAANPIAALQWHNDGTNTYNITRGNNVWAKEDIANDNETTIGASPTSPTFDYNFPYNSTLTAPLSNQDAAITNLFFWNNTIHDVLYQYGFDEVSGNFQNDNQGRGGAGADYVHADAFDGSGTNNANFGTPPDGQNPRMQMFIWNYGTGSITSTPVTTSNIATAGFGPQTFNLTGDLVVAADGTAPVGDGCQTITNSVAGKIAIIDRGNCTFATKVSNAQTAGAIGVLIVQNTAGAPTNMGSDPLIPAASTTIPVLMISQADGNTLKAAVAGGTVSLNMQRNAISVTSDFDNGVITHEYGHGVSNRLTGGPSNTGCLANAEQMGEGWSDFYALMLTTNWTTANMNDLRPIGTYANGSGIREYPYSYNIVASPYNYDYARNSTGVHALGSAWCAMLWDMTWNIIAITPASTNMYTGTGGNNIALQLVTEGLKLQACSPGFIDGRDAILLADEILYNGTYKCAIWNAFARRGLGYSASQGSSAVVIDGVQATDMPPPLAISLTGSKPALFTGEIATYTAKVSCGCGGVQNNVIPTISLPSGLTHQTGGTFGGGNVTFPATNFVEGQVQDFSFTASLSNTVTTPTSIFTDEAETATQFTASQLLGTSPLFATNSNAPLYGNNSWAVDEPAIPSDRDLTLNTAIAIPAASNYSLHFTHDYATEATYDGGVVEFSINNGTNWTDAQALFTQNGYNSAIVNTDNNLTGRAAFTGSSNGKIESIIDLSSFSNQNLLFRFRFGTDTGTGGDGWKIDRIWIGTNVACLPLTADAMQANVSQATASFCQNVAHAPTALSVNCPAAFATCNPVNYPTIVPINGEGGNTITYSVANGSTLPAGTTNVVVTVTDATGHTATCNFDVIVGGATPTISSSPVAVGGIVNTCIGTNVTLTGSPAVEYLWYKNGVAVNYSLNPTYIVGGNTASTAIYTLAVVNTGLSCISKQSDPISIVRTIPNAVITPAGPTAFCTNNPTTLNASIGVGYSYTWKRGNIIVGTNTNSYTPTVSGNHSVVVTNSIGCSKNSGTTVITINPLPVVNAGVDKSVCINAFTTLGIIPNAAYQYSWSPSTHLSSATIANPVVSPQSAGVINYVLSVVNTTTNCANTDNVAVTGLDVPITPTLNSTSTPVCQGASIVLTPANTAGATSLRWFKNSIGIYNLPPTQTLTLTAATALPDVYTIQAKNTAGCFSALSTPITAMINAAPTPTISSTPAAVGTTITVCVPGGTNGSAALTANVPVSAPTVTYSWQQVINSVATNVGAGSSFTANVSTTSNNKIFRVEATYANGCTKTSANRSVKLLTTGCVPKMGAEKEGDLAEMVVETDILSAYPNPTENILHVNIENSQSQIGKLLLYNTLGQIVAQKDLFITNGKGSETFDLSEMAIGIYSLVFEGENIQKVQKVVKE